MTSRSGDFQRPFQVLHDLVVQESVRLPVGGGGALGIEDLHHAQACGRELAKPIEPIGHARGAGDGDGEDEGGEEPRPAAREGTGERPEGSAAHRPMVQQSVFTREFPR